MHPIGLKKKGLSTSISGLHSPVTHEPKNLSRGQHSHTYLKRSIGISEPEPEESESETLLFSAAPALEFGTRGKGHASSLRGPYFDEELAHSAASLRLYEHTIDSVPV